MKKVVCVLAVCVALAGLTAAIEVDERELQVAGSVDSVQFENYGGPHAVIDSAEAIVGIGTALGREVAADLETSAVIQPAAKYTLIHAVDVQTLDGLDADILLLNENAGVDHIRNLRRIVTGYLEAAYGYNRTDAETVSVFVTVYNAVYRGQLPIFSERYKDAVIQYLSADDVGLSTNWEDWAGHTQIVIPLNDLEGGLSAVDTTVISDENVVEALRETEDKGIPEREALADLKERESADASEKAKTAQREAAQQRKDGDKAGAAKSAQESKTQQNIADRKATEAKNDRRTIADDKRDVVAQLPDADNYLTGLFGADDKTGFYTLMVVDSESGKIVRKSPVTQIRSKAVFLVPSVTLPHENTGSVTYPEMIMAVCGMNSGKSACRLCLLDTERLEIQKESNETLSESTSLVLFRDSFYVVIQEGNRCYIGEYDKTATLRHKSAVAIKATSPFNLTDQGILATDANGTPVLLSFSDLSAVWSGTTVDAK